MRSPNARKDSRRLASETSAQQRALHLDDRLPRAQGQSEGHQGLGRPGQARRRGDHAQSEDLRRRALELSRRLGLGRSAYGGDKAKVRDYIAALFSSNVPVLDTGARGSTTTFAQRGIGDVCIAWENEAFLRSTNSARASSRSSRPSVIDPGRTARGGGRKAMPDAKRRTLAKAYLEFLYTPKGQAIVAKHYYRPRNPEAADRAEDVAQFPEARPRHDRQGFRRLGEGADGALRRRRHLRSDLRQEITDERPGARHSSEPERDPGLRADARHHRDPCRWSC